MTCKRCNQSKGSEGFYPSDPNWCKQCRVTYTKLNRPKFRDRDRQYSKDWYKKNRQYTLERKRSLKIQRKAKYEAIKEASPCMDCGNFFPAVCMDYDHRDSDSKINTVSILYTSNCPWKLVEEEMVKCDLVCSNCHRIRTRDRLIESNLD